jgi:Bardet-Biedl syndrome 2 protein
VLQISDLATVADFPEELDSFRQVLTRVDEFHRIRTRLSAEIADSSNIVKAMVCQIY